MPARDSILAVACSPMGADRAGVRLGLLRNFTSPGKRAGWLARAGGPDFAERPAAGCKDAEKNAEENEGSNGLANVEKRMFHGEGMR